MKQETLRKIVELADGFEISKEFATEGSYDIERFNIIYHKVSRSNVAHLKTWISYPLLLRRAVEGWNKKADDADDDYMFIQLLEDTINYAIDSSWCKDGINGKRLWIDKYKKTDYLTPQEQAIEACLIELLEEK